MKLLLKTLIFILAIPSYCFGQDSDPGPGYQLMMINNPALSGSEGDGVFRLSYLNYFPGNNYILHAVYFSYDSYIPSLHGGVGLYLSDDYQGGIVNNFKGGLSYAYFLQAGEDFFINAGLSASFINLGYSFGGAILPDQIDPLGGVSINSSEILTNSGRTIFDTGAGFIFILGKIFGGFSINHLAEPDLFENNSHNDRLKRKLLLHLSGDIYTNKIQSLKVRPIAFMGLQGGFLSAGTGASLEGNYLSINTILLGDKENNIDIQTGFSLQKGHMGVYYNYRFNIVSGNKLLPFSLLHQTGLTFSLNNVDKRKIIKTINFPKL